jgi:GT2 family glycosyltransferase
VTSSLAIVTPWYNHREFMPGYWDAIEAGGPDEVIIVDNGSDPPIEGAAIRFEDNRGFCAANNAGLHIATADAVLFLNNDVDLGRANWLREIRVKLFPKRLVGEIRGGDHTIVDGAHHPYVDGWCIAAMRDDLFELGGWDEMLTEPAYYSDNLLSLRAERAGWDLANISVGLRHLVSGTARDNWGRITRAAAANRTVWEQAVRQPLASVT